MLEMCLTATGSDVAVDRNSSDGNGVEEINLESVCGWETVTNCPSTDLLYLIYELGYVEHMQGEAGPA
jgi:hypothetical protein